MAPDAQALAWRPTTINTLPFETLSIIFVHYASTFPSPEDGCSQGRITVDNPALVLGRVCSRWRRVANATHQLWREVHLSSCDKLTIFDLQPTYIFLSNAGRTPPLTLHIYHQGSESTESDCKDGEDYDAFLKLLAPHARRWTQIDVQSYFQAQGASRLTHAMRGFTSLTQLHVSLPNSSPPSNYTVDWDFIDQFRHAKTTLPTLQHLILDLRSLEDASPTVVPLLEMLNLPALSSLTLLLHAGTPLTSCSIIWMAVARLLKRCSPSLKSIHTSFESNPDYKTIRDVLNLAPLLERAPCFYMGEGALMDLGGSSLSAPNLEELGIHGIPADASIAPIVQTLALRWEGGTGPLQRVFVMEPWPNIGPRWSNFVQRLRTELSGMEVVAEERPKRPRHRSGVQICKPSMWFALD